MVLGIPAASSNPLSEYGDPDKSSLADSILHHVQYLHAEAFRISREASQLLLADFSREVVPDLEKIDVLLFKCWISGKLNPDMAHVLTYALLYIIRGRSV